MATSDMDRFPPRAYLVWGKICAHGMYDGLLGAGRDMVSSCREFSNRVEGPEDGKAQTGEPGRIDRKSELDGWHQICKRLVFIHRPQVGWYGTIENRGAVGNLYVGQLPSLGIGRLQGVLLRQWCTVAKAADGQGPDGHGRV